jgi:hypothetical protein
VSATARPINAPDLLLPDELPADILILPREIDGDMGLYDDSVVTLAKGLQRLGTTATYLHEADSREWIGEKGIDAIVLSLIIGIGSSAGWAGIAALLRGCTSGAVRAKVARCKQTSAGDNEWEWFEIEGSGAEVADALKTLNPGSTSGNPPDGEDDGDAA